MELTVILPILIEILKQEGSFGQKLFIGISFLIALHWMGRNHIKLLTAEMKSMKQEMVKGFESVHGELAVGKLVHEKHDQRITKVEKQIEKINLNSGNTAAT